MALRDDAIMTRPKPDRCFKGLHGPDDIHPINQQRNGKYYVVWRCRACVRSATKNPNSVAAPAWWTERKTFARPSGKKDGLHECRMTCGHSLFFQYVHLPLRSGDRQWCFRCDDYRSLKKLEDW